MRLLIIEDDKRISGFLLRGLRAEGHTCVHSANGREGFSLGLEGDFDLIILDLMLPEMHGHEICQELRFRQNQTPILMLTALDEISDIVHGLKMGADDYMTKPFNYEEFLARIEALGRRGKKQEPAGDMLQIGEVTFDRSAMRVQVAGDFVEFTVKELAILDLLMSNPGKLFSRERILSNVWGLGMDPLTNVVDVYIGKLRKKLQQDVAGLAIVTVRGLGYRLVEKEEE